MLISVIGLLSVLAAVGICLGAGAFGSLVWLWMLPLSAAGVFLALAGLTFVLILLICKTVDLEKDYDTHIPFYRWVVDLLAEAAHTILRMRVHTEGLEKIPADGRFLLVCNHINDLDPVVLLHHFCKSRLAFISKRENDQKFVVGPLLRSIMCQPINRENDREALKTILKCVQLIQKDQASVAVFPEGYTSLDGLLRPFRHGVFKIAQKTKVPIVVCTLKNTRYVFKNAAKLKPTDVYLHLVDVIPAEELAGVTTVEIGRRVYTMMAEDLGPDMVFPVENT